MFSVRVSDLIGPVFYLYYRNFAVSSNPLQRPPLECQIGCCTEVKGQRPVEIKNKKNKKTNKQKTTKQTLIGLGRYAGSSVTLLFPVDV